MQKSITMLLLALFGLLGAAGQASAVTAVSLGLHAGADCATNANLDVGWTGAGTHYEYGLVSDLAGNTIGTFGPVTNVNDSVNGLYENVIQTAQPANAIIGSYAWVGANPPTPATAIEFMVVYNCSTQVVLYRCFGPYGRCAKTAAAAQALLEAASVPATSAEVLAALAVLVAALGAFALRRRQHSVAR